MGQSIWQATDHRPVAAAEADREWTLRATEILAEVAGRYGKSIAHDDLATEVQRRTGIVTDMADEIWLDDVLTEVGRRCAEAGKPLLTVLVDHPGTPVDPGTRRLVYEAYGAKLPKVRAVRSKRTMAAERPKRTVKPVERRRPVCPTCFVELPATGICDDCDA